MFRDYLAVRIIYNIFDSSCGLLGLMDTYVQLNLYIRISIQIDHMNSHKDFTLDSEKFAPDEMRALLDDLHLHGQRYVMIVDPGIASAPDGNEPYPALVSGLAHNVFIRDKSRLAPAQGRYIRMNVYTCAGIYV